jgi:hypothetical protein
MMLTPFGPDHVQSGDDLNADPASHLASAVNTNGIAIIAASHLQAAAMVRYSIGSAVYVLDKQLRTPASTTSVAPSTPLEPRVPRHWIPACSLS